MHEREQNGAKTFLSSAQTSPSAGAASPSTRDRRILTPRGPAALVHNQGTSRIVVPPVPPPPPIFLTKSLFDSGSDPDHFTAPPPAEMETQISLTSVNRGRNLEHSNYLVNTEPPLNQRDKPTGSLATRDRHGWLSLSLTHTHGLCVSLQVWKVLKSSIS